jgi:coenzyme PQQ precursor peptide PqqA
MGRSPGMLPGSRARDCAEAPIRVIIGEARRRRCAMAWTTPTLVEICIGLEINGYLPAEF